MNLNSFKNIYIANNNNRKPLLDYSIIINDSNLENNDIQPYHLDDQINQINSITLYIFLNVPSMKNN